MNLQRAYQTLLRLYPSDYASLLGGEMLDAFEQAAEERRRQSRLAFIRFLVAEFSGLSFGAAEEWFDKLTTDPSVRGRHLPDLRMMRPPGVARELWFAGPSLDRPDALLPAEILEVHAQISARIDRTVYAIAHHDFPGARRYSQEERHFRDELCRLRRKYDLDRPEREACS
jgi:hypothetical protein